ncbi:hypothetical protein KQX54_001149 [Cotesia glomerata]|uniref:Uncharacterized protein n=1 Tax=Cotesia glomerata TaxID=32391 RepID=A0AAV7J3H2_COTGL|nr:hypothetical protein KQX54_001149 [Cotesia glomerata]
MPLDLKRRRSRVNNLFHPAKKYRSLFISVDTTEIKHKSPTVITNCPSSCLNHQLVKQHRKHNAEYKRSSVSIKIDKSRAVIPAKKERSVIVQQSVVVNNCSEKIDCTLPNISPHKFRDEVKPPATLSEVDKSALIKKHIESTISAPRNIILLNSRNETTSFPISELSEFLWKAGHFIQELYDNVDDNCYHKLMSARPQSASAHVTSTSF